jgi:hypothetical protein
VAETNGTVGSARGVLTAVEHEGGGSMTRDHILSLTGSALSEAVAEHVMGWRKFCQAEIVDRLGR